MGVGAYGQAAADDARERLHGLLVEAHRRGKRAGRSEAADELWAWADETAPMLPGEGPSVRRRTIRAAARRIEPEPTVEEMRQALFNVLRGLAPGCVLRAEPTGGTR